MPRSGVRAEGMRSAARSSEAASASVRVNRISVESRICPARTSAHPEREPAAGEVALDEPDDEMRRDGQQEHGGGVDVRQPGA